MSLTNGKSVICTFAALCLLCLALTGTASATVQQAEEAMARKDYIAARKYLEELARTGDPVAQDMLGHMLLFGRGGAVDATRATDLLIQAARQGRSEAQNSMGVICMTGVDGGIDPEAGIAWFREAAKNKHSYAMFNLGRAAEQGLGMSPSMEEALSWYRQAAALGNEPAGKRLEEIERERKNTGKTNASTQQDKPAKSGKKASQQANSQNQIAEKPAPAPKPTAPTTQSGEKQTAVQKAMKKHLEARKKGGSSQPAEQQAEEDSQTKAVTPQKQSMPREKASPRSGEKRRSNTARSNDKAPLPIMYSLSSSKDEKATDTAPGLKIAAATLAWNDEGLELSFSLHNTGPESTGTLSFFAVETNGNRVPIQAKGNPNFKLQRQVHKSYTLPAEVFKNGGTLVIIASADNKPPVEARLEIAAQQ